MRKLSIILLFGAVMLLWNGCTSAGPIRTTPSNAPLWVTDVDQAYPESEWLRDAAVAEDAQKAENAALAGLAKSFSLNLRETINDNERFAQIIVNANRKKKIEISSTNMEVARELSTSVSGLIGVQTDIWTAPDGKVYAIARMNKRECSDRYAAMIRENENLIDHLKAEAAKYPTTFDAFEMLNFAFNAAQVTDNFHHLLTVLDPSATEMRPRYGNAGMINTLVREAARSIVIAVQVEGDIDGRIAMAFRSYFSQLGFRTNSDVANVYTLSAVFKTEKYDADNPMFQFVSYTLTYSITNTSVAGSENDRKGSATQKLARQLAISAVEASIGSTGFAAKFDEYLASLL